jgi:hypothetical protein
MDEKKEITPWYRQPIWLGLLGLALMLGGWKLSTFVSLTVQEEDKERQLADLRRLADDELRGRLPAALKEPPFRLPGRVLCFAGVGLFLLAGVMMYRQPAKTAQSEENLVTPTPP